MRRFVLTLAAAALAGPVPASAAINLIADNVDFSGAPFTFGVTPTDTFTLTYAPQEQYDPSPVLVHTTGNAAVTTVFGAPSVFFTNPPVEFGPNTFPGFSSVPKDGIAPYTLTDSDLGLRYSIGADNYYGYARFAGGYLTSVAFETVANQSILAGAVPEPSSWAMMILGLGLAGAVIRRRKPLACVA